MTNDELLEIVKSMLPKCIETKVVLIDCSEQATRQTIDGIGILYVRFTLECSDEIYQHDSVINRGYPKLSFLVHFCHELIDFAAQITIDKKGIDQNERF